MTAVQLRTELKRMIDRTDDLGLLEWVKNMLASGQTNKEMAEDMLRVARLSDQDIAAGRTYSVDEVKQRLTDRKREA